jgi:hypothetical protein
MNGLRIQKSKAKRLLVYVSSFIPLPLSFLARRHSTRRKASLTARKRFVTIPAFPAAGPDDR